MDENKFVSRQLISVIKFVAAANFLYFFVEFYFAYRVESVSLFSDSIDFLEDSFVNLIVLFGIGRSNYARSVLGRFLSVIMVIPSFFGLYSIYLKLNSHSLPSPEVLTMIGLGALVVNFICAFRLSYYKDNTGALIKTAFLSARNDVIANISIIIAGGATLYYQSFLPDLIVGVGIFLLNLGAANEVWQAAKKE